METAKLTEVHTDTEVERLIRASNRSEVHRVTGIDLSHVSRVFAGKRSASARNVELFAAHFNVEMGQMYRVLQAIRKRQLRRDGAKAARRANRTSRRVHAA